MNQGEGIDQAVTRDVGDDWAAGTPREGEQVVAPQEDDAAANEQGLADGESAVDEEGNALMHDQQLPYVPKTPPRTPAPAQFKAWRQENYGSMMTQAVVQDDAETLIWMVDHQLVDLAATDDLGNTAAHLAVFHDSPRVLRLLHDLGLDLAAPCDAMGFGSAIFYSVFLGRVQCLAELVALGYDMWRPCDHFERTPEMVAERHDQGAALALVHQSLAGIHIQRVFRGFRGREKAKRTRAAWDRENTAAAGNAEPAAEEATGIDGGSNSGENENLDAGEALAGTDSPEGDVNQP